MPRLRHLNRSIASAAVAALFTSVVAARAQENSVQKLLERGQLQEAVDQAGSEENPEATYLAAFALTKMNNNEGAEQRYSRLRDQGDDAWKAIGESGAKLVSGDAGGAMEAANRAVAASGDNPYAHYQIGLVAIKQNNFQRALEAFERAAELKPDLAYAHLYAGQSAQRLKQTQKMAEHFQTFLKVAPEAPERASVQSILRSLR